MVTVNIETSFYGEYAMNKTEKQRAFDYSMYIMLSSYFNKTVCATNMQQQKLYLAYQELKDTEKQQFDEKSVQLIEKELLPKLPSWFFNQQMQVLLLGTEDDEYTELRFQNRYYVLRVKVFYDNKNKKKPVLVHEVWKREIKKSK